MKKRFFSALLCLCLLAGLVPNMGLTAQAAGAAIGQTVEFAGMSGTSSAPTMKQTAASPPRRAATPSLPKTTTLAHRIIEE